MCQQIVVCMPQQTGTHTCLAQAVELLLLLDVVLRPWLIRVVAMGNMGCSGLF